MKVIIINEKQKEEWEDYISRSPNAIAWQSYEWSAMLRKHYAVDFFPIAVYNGSKICGVLPLYHMRSTSGKDVLISVPYAVAGGIVADNEESERVLFEKAIEISGQYSKCNITLKQYKMQIAGELRTDDNYYNRELDISKDPNEIWKDISDKNKQNIEDSKKYDLILEYPSTDINIFYKLLHKHNHNNGIPCVSKKWIQNLITFKMYSAALLKLNNIPVAGTMIKEFKDTVSFPFTCIRRSDEKNRMFAYSLYWKLILKFSSEGKRIFHSGRIPRTDLTDDYRLGWGGTKYSYYYQYHPPTAGKSEYTTKRGRKREIFQALWRILPESVAKLIGPHIVKKFP